MKACASVGPVRRSGVAVDPLPLVLIGGAPEPRLSVETVGSRGPLDIRSARLSVDGPDVSPEVLARWLCSPITVACPHRLVDDTSAWPVLIQGELKRVDATTSAAGQGQWFDLLDGWGTSIQNPVESIWWLNSTGGLIKQPAGVLSIGSASNRSVGVFDFNGEPAHVIENGSGLSWTVATALATASAFAGLSLLLHGLPREIAMAQLLAPIDLTRPVAEALKSIIEPYGLVIQRDINRSAGVIVERRCVRPISKGRPVRVGWADTDQPLGEVLKAVSDRPAQAAQLWIVRAGGWLVESTFELVGAWDPALEGQPDSDYDMANSSDFAAFADVFRRWVLNEDGFFTGPPYNQGPTFDLTAFFAMGEVDPQTLEFKSNITLETDGTAKKPIVEMSTDAGSSWSVFPNSFKVITGRAGVYLDPPTLPPVFLTAAKAGLARLRVTASLKSPHRVELQRWRGNAFTGKLPPRVIDRSGIFRFQRVDDQSIHQAKIQTGELQADELDQTNQMRAWLIDQMMLHEQGGEPNDGRATVELAGAWPMLRPGDRLMQAGGPGLTAAGQAQALTNRGAHVRSLLTRYKPRAGRGRSTTVELTF